MLQLVHIHEQSKKLHSIKKERTKFATELNIEAAIGAELPCTLQARNLNKRAKKEGLKKIKERWEGKPLHGQYPKRSKHADVDQQKTHQWLRGTGLKAETDNGCARPKSVHQKLPIKNSENGTDPIFKPSEYSNRHDRIGQYIHCKMCKHYNTPHCEKWYEHKTPPVIGESTTILWVIPINTDRTIKANRPDIVIKDYKSKTCLLNDMTIPTDRKISVKEFDKLSKYEDLQIEIERMW